MKQDTTSLQHLLTTIEFCSLEPLERALKLMKDHGVGRRTATKVCGVSEKSIRCVLDAKAKGRPIGVIGRSKLLNPIQEQELVDALVEADQNKKECTFEQFQDKVC